LLPHSFTTLHNFHIIIFEAHRTKRFETTNPDIAAAKYIQISKMSDQSQKPKQPKQPKQPTRYRNVSGLRQGSIPASGGQTAEAGSSSSAGTPQFDPERSSYQYTVAHERTWLKGLGPEAKNSPKQTHQSEEPIPAPPPRTAGGFSTYLDPRVARARSRSGRAPAYTGVQQGTELVTLDVQGRQEVTQAHVARSHISNDHSCCPSSWKCRV
jgi:hypothetical protein